MPSQVSLPVNGSPAIDNTDVESPVPSSSVSEASTSAVPDNKPSLKLAPHIECIKREAGSPSKSPPKTPSPTDVLPVHAPSPRHPIPADYMGARLSQQTVPSPNGSVSSRSDSPYEQTEVPPSLLSPAFTPPTTPGTPNLAGYNVQTSKTRPKLMKELPEVNCVVRARIPT